MKENTQKGQEGEGHVICGISSKNGINGTIPGISSCGDGRVLDLSGLNNLLVADLDYFVEHHEEILGMAKGQIEKRDYFREHPEEYKKWIEANMHLQPFQDAFNQKIDSREDV